MATVLTGVALLIFWEWKVSHDYSLDTVGNGPELTSSGKASPGERSPRPQASPCVGQITGMVACRWGDPQHAPPAAVLLGRKYELTSGLVEITYQTGAKVILQGPCTYEVDSAAGGFLSLGKLTARVEKVARESSEVRNRRSKSYPLSTIHYPLFSSALPPPSSPTWARSSAWRSTSPGPPRRTSSAARSNCGRPAARTQPGQVVRLEENESARVERRPGPGFPRDSVKPARDPGDDLRRGTCPAGRRSKLFNTGVGLKEGDPDPHWQLVARSDDPHFKPWPAVVTAAIPD